LEVKDCIKISTVSRFTEIRSTIPGKVTKGEGSFNIFKNDIGSKTKKHRGYTQYERFILLLESLLGCRVCVQRKS
jgi:hypothetical protein